MKRCTRCNGNLLRLSAIELLCLLCGDDGTASGIRAPVCEAPSCQRQDLREGRCPIHWRRKAVAG